MQGELFRARGGKRKGAGRPPKGKKAGEAHKKREVVRENWPVHVTLRVARDAPYLRKRAIWRAIVKATIAASKSGAVRIVHASVQCNHLHILVETSDQYALAKGMHAFEVSAAHWINRAAQRRGRVFPDRYHVHVLKTPREVRNAIRYVLSNWRIDYYSTGYAFWNAAPPVEYESLPVEPALTWLLREGWQKAGEISPYEKPAR